MGRRVVCSSRNLWRPAVDYRRGARRKARRREQQEPHRSRVGLGVGIVGAIAVSGIGEIVDDVDADPRRVDDGSHLRSLVCAPLEVGDKVIGAIALGSTVPKPYAAAKLKLLNTLALQTATAIENARLAADRPPAPIGRRARRPRHRTRL